MAVHRTSDDKVLQAVRLLADKLKDANPAEEIDMYVESLQYDPMISIKEGRTVEWLQSRKGKNLDQCIHLVRFVLSNSAQGTIVGSAGPLETKETSQKDLRSLNLKEVAMRVVLCKLVRGEEDGEMLAKRQAAYLSAFCQAEQDRDPGDVDEMKQALGSRTKMERKALRAQKLIERAGANHDLRQKVTACVPLV